MIIRSQDKKELHNLDRISMLRVVPSIGKNQKYIIEVNSQHPIGEYATEEKAIKVLDMISDAYLSRMELDGGYDAVTGCYVQPNFWVLPKRFQMPQDSEV